MQPQLLEHPDMVEEPGKLFGKDPREDLTVPQLIGYYGYGAQIHHVTTEDGYILELHRMFSPNVSNCALTKNQDPSNDAPGKCQPVLLQHGLLSSSATWVMNYPNKSLPYILADQGFDVWMGNARGCIYSMKHTTLSPKSYAFWDFSFDEMGKYDLPAVFEYILTQNAYPKLHYAGHSMGTTMYWILEQMRPGYAETKVSSMTAMGPVAYLSRGTSPMEKLAPLNKVMDNLFRNVLHIYRMFSPNSWITKLVEGSCNAFKVNDKICSNLLFLLIGFDEENLETDWLPVIMKQMNAGASTKTIVHFGQLMQDSTFAMFDYHSANMNHYHQTTAPAYHLSYVRTPVLLKYGKNDILADVKDVDQMLVEMNSTTVINSEVTDPKFNHLDFLWGKEAVKLVYNDVIKFIKQNM